MKRRFKLLKQPADIDNMEGFDLTGLADGDLLRYDLAAEVFEPASPSSLTFTASQISDFAEVTQDTVGTLIQNGTGITWAYVDGSATLTGTVSLAPFSTTNLAEGTNLYYTDVRVTAVLSAAYTAADVLAKLLTVDGAGSLLDADLLDGLSSAAFVQGPAGATTQVQFNDAGVLGATAALTIDKATNTVTVGDATTAGSVVGAAGAATSAGQTLTLIGGAGGATSGTGGQVRLRGGLPLDGNGGEVLLSGRGAATTTATNRTGGAVTALSGTGVLAGSGGALSLTSGTGGATGAGGAGSLSGGAGGATSGNGGSVTVQGGLPVDGNGGSVTVTGRAGVGTNRNGGNVTLVAGAATGSGTAGTVIVTGTVTLTGNLTLAAAGNGVAIKEGTNAAMGVATLVLGTLVVNNTRVTANSRIQLTTQALGTVTVPSALAVSARTAGTSFTILASALTDTSVVAWQITEPA